MTFFFHLGYTNKGAVEKQIQIGKLNLQFIRLIRNIIKQHPSPPGHELARKYQRGKEDSFDRKTGKLGTKIGIVSPVWMTKMLNKNQLRPEQLHCLRSKEF
jgi:hypothetical protein